MRKTSKSIGWQLLVKWKDGSESWFQLRYIKKSNTVDVAKYATSRGVEYKPVFSLWLPHIFRRHDVIMVAVSSRMSKCSLKYGIE